VVAPAPAVVTGRSGIAHTDWAFTKSICIYLPSVYTPEHD
jgi:hypothetical protein